MKSQDILLIDLASEPCGAGSCSRIQELIRRLWPRITCNATANIPANANWSTQALLTIVRFSACDSSQRAVNSVRQQVASGPIFGILCGMNSRAPGCLPILEDLDDFVCCPSSELEISARIRRLMGSNQAILTIRPNDTFVLKE